MMAHPQGPKNYNSIVPQKGTYMTINLTFNDFGEMKAAIVEMAKLITADKMAQEIVKKIPEKSEKKAGSNVPEQPTVPPMPKPVKAEEPKIDRVELRKILSVLNKSTGKNTARELINGMGFRALTDVPDDRLAELKAKAEEVINAQ